MKNQKDKILKIRKTRNLKSPILGKVILISVLKKKKILHLSLPNLKGPYLRLENSPC